LEKKREIPFPTENGQRLQKEGKKRVERKRDHDHPLYSFAFKERKKKKGARTLEWDLDRTDTA